MIEIAAFPKDNIERVVINYGKMKKNSLGNSKSPLVEIIMRPLKKDEEGKEVCRGEEKSYYIALGEVVIVRIGSVWKGQEKLNRYWKYPEYRYEKRQIVFDLDANPPINFIIDKNKDLIEVEENVVGQQDTLYHTTFTSMIDSKKNRVFVPSIELFTNTYLPRNKRMREDLCLHSIDTVRKRYVKEYACKSDTYKIKTKRLYAKETIAFLSHLSCNKKARSNISLILSSLQAGYNQSGEDTQYSYMLAKPYHPHKLEFEASGYWYKNKIFFVQRINHPKAPSEKKYIVSFEKEIYSKTKKQAKKPRINDEKEEGDALITAALSPGGNIGVKHIITDVSPDNKSLDLEYEEINREVPKKPYFPTEEDIENNGLFSSGEISGEEESKGVGRVEYDFEEGDDEIKEEEEKDIYQMLFGGLWELIESGLINKFNFINEKGESVEEAGYCTPKSARRNILLVEVEISLTVKKYFMEIERKNSDSFMGASFIFKDGISKIKLKKLLKNIVDNYYRLNKIPVSKLPVEEFKIFKHNKKKRIMYKKFEILLGVSPVDTMEENAIK